MSDDRHLPDPHSRRALALRILRGLLLVAGAGVGLVVLAVLLFFGICLLQAGR